MIPRNTIMNTGDTTRCLMLTYDQMGGGGQVGWEVYLKIPHNSILLG